MGGYGYSYHRIDIGILIIDGFYGKCLADYISFGVDNGHVFRVRHQVIEIADGNLVEQDAHEEDRGRKYLVEDKFSRFIRCGLKDDRGADDNEMQDAEYEGDTRRHDSGFRSLGIQAFVAGTYLPQEMVDESFLLYIG